MATRRPQKCLQYQETEHNLDQDQYSWQSLAVTHVNTAGCHIFSNAISRHQNNEFNSHQYSMTQVILISIYVM